MSTTKIEWTATPHPDGRMLEGYTFNPWWGCTHNGPECDHCYAEAFAKRTGHEVWGHDARRRFFGLKYWSEPLKWDATAKAEGVKVET